MKIRKLFSLLMIQLMLGTAANAQFVVGQTITFDYEVPSIYGQNETENTWCVQDGVYSIDGPSLQLCGQNGVGYSGQGGQSNIAAFGLNTGNYSRLSLTFDWKCNGEKDKDYGRVFYWKNGVWEVLADRLQSGETGSQNKSIELPLCLNYQPNLLIGFAFICDSYFNFQPGFVVDNIRIDGAYCPLGTDPTAPVSPVPITSCYEAYGSQTLFISTQLGNTHNWYRDECGTSIHQGGSYVVYRNINQTYLVTSVSNSNGCESRPPYANVVLNIRDLPSINVDQLSPTEFGYDGSIVISYGGTSGPYQLEWSGPQGFQSNQNAIGDLIAGNYAATVTDLFGCDSVRVITVEEGSGIRVPSGFSPNNDGKNDAWILEGIDQWEDFEIHVYTLRGELVHEQSAEISQQYVPWNGDGIRRAETLPDGDYMYVITSKIKDRKYRGVVTIKTKL